MAQILASVFFAGLLIMLAVILEQIVKAHWAEIVAALRGEAQGPVRPAARRAQRPAAA